MGDDFAEKARRLRKKLGGRPPCKKETVCGPCLRAFVAAAERRRIRRVIAPVLRKLRSAPSDIRAAGIAHMAAEAIDAATRAPKRRSR